MAIQKTTIEDLKKMKANFWHLIAKDAASTETLYSDESLDFILEMYKENIDKFSPEFTDLYIVFDDFNEKIYYSI